MMEHGRKRIGISNGENMPIDHNNYKVQSVSVPGMKSIPVTGGPFSTGTAVIWETGLVLYG